MSDQTDLNVTGSGKSEAKAEQIRTALGLWEQVGEKLRTPAESLLRDQTALQALVSNTEQFVLAVRSIGKIYEHGSEQTEEQATADPATPIPQKQYYKIGDVSEIIGVEPYVLLYWESEFKVPKPIRTRARQRLYSINDLEIFRTIRSMIYGERLTIAGMKKRLKAMGLIKSPILPPLPQLNYGSLPAADESSVPDKRYFKMNEVSEILNVEPYVIKWWNSEFKVNKPRSTRARELIFTKTQVERLLEIKHLVYHEKFTIAGARKRIREWDKLNQKEKQQARKARAAAQRRELELSATADETAATPSLTSYAEYAEILADIREDVKGLLEILTPEGK